MPQLRRPDYQPPQTRAGHAAPGGSPEGHVTATSLLPNAATGGPDAQSKPPSYRGRTVKGHCVEITRVVRCLGWREVLLSFWEAVYLFQYWILFFERQMSYVTKTPQGLWGVDTRLYFLSVLLNGAGICLWNLKGTAWMSSCQTEKETSTYCKSSLILCLLCLSLFVYHCQAIVLYNIVLCCMSRFSSIDLALYLNVVRDADWHKSRCSACCMQNPITRIAKCS